MNAFAVVPVAVVVAAGVAVLGPAIWLWGRLVRAAWRRRGRRAPGGGWFLAAGAVGGGPVVATIAVGLVGATFFPGTAPAAVGHAMGLAQLAGVCAAPLLAAVGLRAGWRALEGWDRRRDPPPPVD